MPMRNIFLLYMPPNNLEAMTHYQDTIQQKVSFDRISRFVSRDVGTRLKRIFGERRIAVWGSRDTRANRAKFEKMSEGDDLLIVEGTSTKFMGKVALKVVSSELSHELWDNLNPAMASGWELIYFIGNAVEIDVPFREFCRLFEYEETYQLRGFTSVSNDKLEAFYERYDDLYSILMRIRSGQVVAERAPLPSRPPDLPPVLEVQPEDIHQVLQSPLVSDHVKMQGLRPARKSGSRAQIRVNCGRSTTSTNLNQSLLRASTFQGTTSRT